MMLKTAPKRTARRPRREQRENVRTAAVVPAATTDQSSRRNEIAFPSPIKRGSRELLAIENRRPSSSDNVSPPKQEEEDDLITGIPYGLNLGEPVISIGFSADSRRAVIGGFRGGVYVLDTADGSIIRQLNCHTDSVEGVCLTQDGGHALTASVDGICVFWNVNDGKRIKLRGRVQGVQQFRDCAMDAKGRVALAAFISLEKKGFCVLYDPFTNKEHFKFDCYDPWACDLSADGRLALTPGENGFERCVCLWNCQTGQRIRTLNGHRGIVYDMNLSSNGAFAISGATDQKCNIFRTSDGKCLRTFSLDNEVYNCSITDDGSMVFIGMFPDTIQLYSVANGKMMFEIHGSGTNGRGLINSDGSLLLHSSRTSQVGHSTHRKALPGHRISFVSTQMLRNYSAKKQLESVLQDMLKAHGQLLVKEKARWNRWRIMLVGKGLSGKTSTYHALCGHEFNPDKESTQMADVKEGTLASRRDTKPDKKSSEVRVDVNIIRARENQGVEFMESKERNPADNFEKTAAKAARQMKERFEREDIERLLAEKGVDGKNVDENSFEPSTVDNLDAEPGVEKSSLVEEVEGPVSPPVHERGPLVKALDASMLSSLFEDDSIQLSIWDFAGQEAYYSAHQLFLNSRSDYIVVFNLEEWIDEKKRDEVLRFVRFWFESIKTYGSDNKNNAATVFVVATHLDKLREQFKDEEKLNDTLLECDEQIMDIFQRVFGESWEENFIRSDHMLDGTDAEDALMMFPIDCTNSKDPCVTSLRERIFASLQQRINNIEKVPLAWTKVCDELMTRKEDWMRIQDIRRVSKRFGISEEWEVRAMLRRFNQLGSIIYFDRWSGILDEVGFMKFPDETKEIAKRLIDVRDASHAHLAIEGATNSLRKQSEHEYGEEKRDAYGHYQTHHSESKNPDLNPPDPVVLNSHMARRLSEGDFGGGVSANRKRCNNSSLLDLEEYAVLKPQFLLNCVKRIIYDKKIQARLWRRYKRKATDREKWEEFFQRGIIHRSLLQNLWEDDINGDRSVRAESSNNSSESKDLETKPAVSFIIKVLEKYMLLCRFGEGDRFVVPAMLPLGPKQEEYMWAGGTFSIEGEYHLPMCFYDMLLSKLLSRLSSEAKGSANSSSSDFVLGRQILQRTSSTLVSPTHGRFRVRRQGQLYVKDVHKKSAIVVEIENRNYCPRVLKLFQEEVAQIRRWPLTKLRTKFLLELEMNYNDEDDADDASKRLLESKRPQNVRFESFKVALSSNLNRVQLSGKRGGSVSIAKLMKWVETDEEWAAKLTRRKFEELSPQGVMRYFRATRKLYGLTNHTLDILKQQEFGGSMLFESDFELNLRRALSNSVGKVKRILGAIARFKELEDGNQPAARPPVRIGHVLCFDPSDVKVEKKLGKGHFGSAHLAMIYSLKKKVVLKVPHRGEGLDRGAMREFQAMAQIKPHPNIVEFIGCMTLQDKRVCFMTAMCEFGSLDKLHDKFDLKSRFLDIVAGVCAGVSHLHRDGILHRDLACRNILMKSDFTVAICDFGLSRQISDKDFQISDEFPWLWAAPEAIRTGQFTKESDVWSLGVTMWEILTGGKIPYVDHVTSRKQKIRGIVDGKVVLKIPAMCSTEARRVTSSCLEHNPSLRPTAASLLADVKSLRNGKCTVDGGDAVVTNNVSVEEKEDAYTSMSYAFSVRVKSESKSGMI